ncbi:hypothetical protein NCCP133_34510 [Cytobacillus sp. NCCP-133]|nr:hypothetical protein NCCP133_34510 [Cytobacillus sp. NCCP-133]
MQSEMAIHTLQEIYHRREVFHKKPYVLALLTFHMIGMEPGLSYLRNLNKKSNRFRVSGDESFLANMQPGELIRSIGNDDWIPLRNIKKSYISEINGIFLPILSFSLINDLLSLNEQRPFVRLILEALLKGKKVVALKTGADPYDSYWKMEGMDKGPVLLKRKLHNQLLQLKSMGISVIAVHENADFSTAFKKSVITEGIVRNAHQRNMTELEIQGGSIITPLARDTARELNILLKTL